MPHTSSTRFAEHPLDVLKALAGWQTSEKCALVIITDIVGGSVRKVGSLMAVAASGKSAGYLSGGCIDQDVIVRVQTAIESEETVSVLYGAGSLNLDLPLPCGGSIRVLIIPNPNKNEIQRIKDLLLARLPVRVSYHSDGIIEVNTQIHCDKTPSLSIIYEPKIRIRIAGRGADCLALARLALESGFDIQLQLTSEADICDASNSGIETIEHLKSPAQLPPNSDDHWTAFVLAFHDPYWEYQLLEQALQGAARYIGAIGSKRTHERRANELRKMNVCKADIERIRAPIGLISSLRDASWLSISILGEVIQEFSKPNELRYDETAIILLAAGYSSRFESGDKLLADYKGHKLLTCAANLGRSLPFSRFIAVTTPAHEKRHEILSKSGWEVSLIAHSGLGQSASIQAGINEIQDDHGLSQIIIILADMPNIPPHHLQKMMLGESHENTVVFSVSEGTLMPPALFSRNHFELLQALQGDQGAKSVLATLPAFRTVALDSAQAIDIDTLGDLDRAPRV